MIACVSDNPECCRLLLGAKADANTTKDDGQTMLNAAVHGGSIECVQLLLQLGAAQTINKMNRIGTHPMHWACQEAYSKILERANTNASTEAGSKSRLVACSSG